MRATCTVLCFVHVESERNFENDRPARYFRGESKHKHAPSNRPQCFSSSSLRFHPPALPPFVSTGYSPAASPAEQWQAVWISERMTKKAIENRANRPERMAERSARRREDG